MTRRRTLVTLVRRLANTFLCAVLTSGCGSPAGAPEATTTNAPSSAALLPVPLPDLSKMTGSVQRQIRDAHASLTREMQNRQTPGPGMADAYGSLGKILMAADHHDAAEPCFLNAQTLAPNDIRWPYYLAHLSRDRGDLAKAAALFERALQLEPDDVASLVWLGDVQLAQGQADRAEPLFTKALSLQANSLSSRFGLGRAALAKQDYRRAVTYLEEVLELDPEAAGVHYPLGMAYQGLGQASKAEAHLRLRQNKEILPADPLMVEIEELLESPQAYESRGIRALDAKNWSEAEALFRKGLTLAPESAALRHRLGTALYMKGDTANARTEFEHAVRMAPDNFLAQYSLGVILQAEGRHREAIERFSAAVRARSTYAEARLGLASSLRRVGQAKESLEHYEQILATNATRSEAKFGYAIALAQAGRYQDARDRLTAGMTSDPNASMFAHALARLLAAAPDDRVRDAQRSRAIVEELLAREQRSLDLGETMAMAMAEMGRFEDAASLQRDLMTGAGRAGLHDVTARLQRNLDLYERRQPCRTPWSDEELP